MTAVRETLEETGLDLRTGSRILGRLDDLRPRTPHLPPIIVTPFVAAVPEQPPLILNHEIADAFWVPWSRLTDPATTRESEVSVRGSTWRTPAFMIDTHVIWGMTERIIRQLISRIEQ